MAGTGPQVILDHTFPAGSVSSLLGEGHAPIPDVDEKYFVRVDLTDEFPYLVTKLSPYCDR